MSLETFVFPSFRRTGSNSCIGHNFTWIELDLLSILLLWDFFLKTPFDGKREGRAGWLLGCFWHMSLRAEDNGACLGGRFCSILLLSTCSTGTINIGHSGGCSEMQTLRPILRGTKPESAVQQHSQVICTHFKIGEVLIWCSLLSKCKLLYLCAYLW